MARRTIGNLGSAAAAVVSVALLLTGCGGEAAAPAGPPPASTAAAPATSAAVPVTAAPTASPVPGPPRPPAPVPAATPRPVPGAGSSSGVTRCTTGRLNVSLGPAEGTAGSVHRTLRLTNAGGATCVVRGFPGVSYVAGDDGHQVGPAAAFVGARGVAVDLPAGRTAAAALTLLDVGVLDESACHPVAVRGLRVYPPGSTTALFVPMEGRGCSADPGRAQLTVAGLRAS